MRNSEYFNVGDEVYCTDPDGFKSQVAAFLKNRIGIVTKVMPAKRPDENYCLYTNVVVVRWLKKGNRGKEELMMMGPNYIDLTSNRNPVESPDR